MRRGELRMLILKRGEGGCDRERRESAETSAGSRKVFYDKV